MIFFQNNFKEMKFLIFSFFIFFFMANLESKEIKNNDKIFDQEQKEVSEKKLYSEKIKRFKLSDFASGIFFQRDTKIVDFAIILSEMGDIFEKNFLKENNIENGSLISDHLIGLIEMGSENYQSPEDFREKINEYGIQFSLNQTQDDLVLRIRCLKEYLPEAFSLVFNAFLRPNFSSDNLKIVKNYINSEMKAFYQNNEALAKTYFIKNLFKDSIYEEYFPKKENNLIDSEILRKYHSEILNKPKKIKIIAVGDFKENQEMFDENFKDFLNKVLIF